MMFMLETNGKLNSTDNWYSNDVGIGSKVAAQKKMEVCLLFGKPNSYLFVANKMKSDLQDLVLGSTNHEDPIIMLIIIPDIFHHGVVNLPFPRAKLGS
jgi:hypothetical protein